MARYLYSELSAVEMLRIESRAAYLASLQWPSTPWTDSDHARFAAASNYWDALAEKVAKGEIA